MNEAAEPSAGPAPDGATALEVVEYTDPLCPWSWGSEPVFRQLRAGLAGRARWRRAYAILFDEDEEPAPDPAAETAWYEGYVAEIAAHTGAPRADRLRRVAASSWPASQTAAAAELQGPQVAERVLRRLRETVFVLGVPADTPESALAAARGVPGLDADRLAADAASPAVRARVAADRAEARRPVPEVREAADGSPHPGAAKETPDGELRYALPTLLFRSGDRYRAVPGRRGWAEYAAAVASLCPEPLAAPAPLAPAAALARFATLTGPEAAVLTTGSWPPPDAVRQETAGGPLWLHPSEAAARPGFAPEPGPHL
ncbi:DsbA family protein [Streptomyces sp. SCSIO ZS0520]|uniref:DsbA family protein n=1 Tax=Streptomyces sp. SCSIO ZS0520 TaxID=2892996 RepID=UPI0021D8672E|nr:DsbA family protein [Streptomyces sp. SCSIO ZS0520]